jgi:hypothetical protein
MNADSRPHRIVGFGEASWRIIGKRDRNTQHPIDTMMVG